MVLWEIGRNFPIQKTKWLQLANQIMSTFLELDDASVSETEARQNSSLLTGMEQNSNPSKKVEQDSRPLTDTRETIPRSRPRITRLESSESTVFLLLTVVLQRLSAFIPEMRRANAELQTKDPKMYNIEVEEGSDNLGLGVYEAIAGDAQEELVTLKMPGDVEERKRPVGVLFPNTDTEQSESSDSSNDEEIG